MNNEMKERFIRFLNSEDGEIISFDYRKPNGLDIRANEIKVLFRRRGTDKRISASIKSDGKMYEKQEVSLDD